MLSDRMSGSNEPLETAAELERAKILKKSASYKMAKLGLIPSYSVGLKRRGVRFRRSEVLAALRRPAVDAGGER